MTKTKYKKIINKKKTITKFSKKKPKRKSYPKKYKRQIKKIKKFYKKKYSKKKNAGTLKDRLTGITNPFGRQNTRKCFLHYNPNSSSINLSGEYKTKYGDIINEDPRDEKTPNCMGWTDNAQLSLITPLKHVSNCRRLTYNNLGTINYCRKPLRSGKSSHICRKENDHGELGTCFDTKKDYEDLTKDINKSIELIKTRNKRKSTAKSLVEAVDIRNKLPSPPDEDKALQIRFNSIRSRPDITQEELDKRFDKIISENLNDRLKEVTGKK